MFMTYAFFKFYNEIKSAAITAAIIAEVLKRFQSCKKTVVQQNIKLLQVLHFVQNWLYFPNLKKIVN